MKARHTRESTGRSPAGPVLAPRRAAGSGSKARRLSAVAAILAALATSSVAQLVPPARPDNPVLDPSRLIVSRGHRLEIYPTVRADREVAADGSIQRRLKSTAADAPMSGNQLGVVYDHTLGAQGFLTGEITFRIRTAAPSADLQSLLGFKAVVRPDVYEIVATRPDDLAPLQAMLQARGDIAWVEVVVRYGPSVGNAITLQKAARPSTTPRTPSAGPVREDLTSPR